VERGLIQSLHNRASPICQERQDLFNEISSPRCEVQLNDYPQGFIDSVINSKGSSRLNKEQKPLGSMYISHVMAAPYRWLPTAAARVQSRVWSSGICGGQSGAGAGFLRVLRFPLPFIPPNSPSSQSPGAGTIGQD
jgi:hypothetical protein